MRKTHTIIGLDRSSSMADRPGKKQRTLNDYNEQVDMAQDFDGNEQEVTVSLCTFNHEVKEHLWMADAEELQQSTDEQYICKGGTALTDCLGYIYSKVKETIIPELGKEDAVLIQILTDGEENSSQKFKGAAGAAEVAKLGEELEATGQVTITFMGAEKAAVEKASQDYGLNAANCAFIDTSSNEAMAQGYAMRRARSQKFYGSRSVAKGAGPVVTACADYMSDDGSMADFTDQGSKVESKTDKEGLAWNAPGMKNPHNLNDDVNS